MLRRTDRPSHEEMSVEYKGWLSFIVVSVYLFMASQVQDKVEKHTLTGRSHKLAQAERWRWLAVEIWEEWDLFEWNAMFEGTNDVYRGLPGPRLGFLLGGSAEGVQRIGSGSSTRSKKLIPQIFSHARACFGHII